MTLFTLLGCACTADGLVDSGCVAHEWFEDVDTDGWGAGEPFDACDGPVGFVAVAGDCDDGDATVSPSAEEVPYDEIDQDCDGLADDDDLDEDGYGVETDCNDSDSTVYPGADEEPYDGVDQDCDGRDLDDLDSDGYGISEDCDDEDPNRNPGQYELCADGIDQDCDGQDEACWVFDGLGWLELKATLHGHKAEKGVSGGGAWTGSPSSQLGLDLRARPEAGDRFIGC